MIDIVKNRIIPCDLLVVGYGTDWKCDNGWGSKKDVKVDD